MKKEYKNLFEPYILNNGVEIKNRLVVAPMTLFAANEDGTFGQGDFDFIKGRSYNIGMFIVEATLISKEGKAFVRQPEAIGEKDLDGMKKVAQIIQSEGSKAILQLHHGGKMAITDNKVAPSDDKETGARELTDEEIENLIKCFGKATDLAIKAGFDGVEIHGANGYLLQQFYSAQSNRRIDKWGGTRENRMRFLMKVVDEVVSVKEQNNADKFIVGYRFSPEEPGEYGLTMEDTFELVDKLVTKPLQYLHVSLHDFYKKARRGADTTKTRMELLHQRINGKLAFMGVGKLFTANEISQAFDTGWAEFIALGKTIIINPDIANLISEGREDEIVTELDINKPDRYNIPELLWEMCKKGSPILPPLKDAKNWKPLDI